MPKGTRVTAETWARIKVEWQMGKGTFKELSLRHGVAVKTIQNRSNKERWQITKARTQQEVMETLEEENRRILTALGMPHEKVLELLVDGALNADKVMFEGPKGEMMATPVPDYQTRLKFLHEIAEYSSKKSPAKKAIDHTTDGKPINANIPIIVLPDNGRNPSKEAA